ncbi:pentapeptide repeat-containing protein [Umezawaea sp. Da 62-37]|uniref:pentapeptide repeat-containing protein n=1 Tax=Umezawaea sp. Da 62-37 TaxID=3075927 RepID=UPI0028F70397|nr:pentapeptide repeat-containing protein [Umezawaea sp. Da 62-37]WNV86653.1 pentapeptide repeat-containing protein [Umezawaea sp. Da 62-37]WNV86764.1 pentapeptide repeat-containing protein [Umezawaea sp. Da 62-37]
MTFVDADKRATAHLDVLKLTASIAVGGGGLFALYLAARRQRTQELELAQRKSVQAHVEDEAKSNRAHVETVQALAAQVADHNREDAAARRVTELYSKSVEQLGSDQAAVRLGGLYALERLAQDNPDQRRTVGRVLCAYLRMPFEVPDAPPWLEDVDGLGYKTLLAEYRERVQEREVRVAAQRVLRDHLLKGDEAQPLPTFWADIALDLRATSLVDFDLARCTVGEVDFRSATFTGEAHFEAAMFTGDVDFVSATFIGAAHFKEATFTSGADFVSATFDSTVDFASARFTNGVLFGLATFKGYAHFKAATFTKLAFFKRATFASIAFFNKATFTDAASFKGTEFASRPQFTASVFIDGVPPEVSEFVSEHRSGSGSSR